MVAGGKRAKRATPGKVRSYPGTPQRCQGLWLLPTGGGSLALAHLRLISFTPPG
jgi:hypothetical protein